MCLVGSGSFTQDWKKHRESAAGREALILEEIWTEDAERDSSPYREMEGVKLRWKKVIPANSFLFFLLSNQVQREMERNAEEAGKVKMDGR